MGIAARLFFNASDPEKQTLTVRCTISEEQFDEQIDRWNALAEYVRDDLKQQTGYTAETWLQGSYKFRTQIRPVNTREEFDIDLGIYLNVPDDHLDQHDSAYFKDLVKQSVSRYAASIRDEIKGDIEIKSRCIRLRYKNGFHIDLPVYVRVESDASVMLAGKDDWEDSDPKALHTWFKTKFDEQLRPILRRHVKYMKAWAALKFPEADRPTSIMLTVLVADVFQNLTPAQLEHDDETFHTIVAAIVDRLSRAYTVPNPANPGENLNRLGNDKTEDLITALLNLQELTERALAQDSVLRSADIWQLAFFHLFPLPDQSIENPGQAPGLPALAFLPEIEVLAGPKNNALGPRFRGTNEIGPIPKDCSITFRLTNAESLPPGSVVNWYVRNQGREAELLNDLGHTNKSAHSVTETSSYKGTHYMDCIIRRDGFMIGRRQVPVKITGVSMPSRANTKGKSWRKFVPGRR